MIINVLSQMFQQDNSGILVNEFHSIKNYCEILNCSQDEITPILNCDGENLEIEFAAHLKNDENRKSITSKLIINNIIITIVKKRLNNNRI